MSSQLLSPYRSLVHEVHRRLQRLYRCALWMLERGHAGTARDMLAASSIMPWRSADSTPSWLGCILPGGAW